MQPRETHSQALGITTLNAGDRCSAKTSHHRRGLACMYASTRSEQLSFPASMACAGRELRLEAYRVTKLHATLNLSHIHAAVHAKTQK